MGATVAQGCGPSTTAKTKPMMCCWAQPTQHMKNNLDRAAMALLPEAPASVSERMAAGLWAAAVQFGIKCDAWFQFRVCAVGFGNGLLLGAREPEAAPRYLEVLQRDLPLPSGCLTEATRLACEHCTDGCVVQPFWEHVLPQLLGSTGIALDMDSRFPLAGRRQLLRAVAASARLGLECCEANPGMAARWMEVTKSMSNEDLFLTTRLYIWVATGYVPFASPLIEFSCGFYADPPKPKERAFINAGLAKVLPVALLQDNPWALGFWSNAGWNYGRGFASERQQVRELVEELGSREVLDFLMSHYADTVIDIADGNGGRLDLVRSTLKHFASTRQGKLALIYGRGEQPRLRVQRAFDYAAWMGLVSVLPQPTEPADGR